ncbi:MAG: hypothetical protein RR909_04155 [Bacilli bacterium]
METMIIGVGICIFSIISVSILFIILYAFSRKRRDRHYLNSYFYTIDYANKTVRYFNKKKLLGVNTISLDEFYLLFSLKSGKDIKNFVDSTFENTGSESKTVECDSLRKIGEKHFYFSILEISSVNYKRQILHLNQYFFNKLPLRYEELPKFKLLSDIIYNTKDEDIENLFKKTKPYVGASFIFEITLMSNNKTESLKSLVLYQFKNILAKYSKGRYIISFSSNQFVLHDFKIRKYIPILKLLKNIKHDFDLFLDLNSLSLDVRVNVGVVEHKYFPQNYNKVLKALKSIGAEATNVNKQYIIYDESKSNDFFFDKSYIQEIESLISAGKLIYNFRPILDTKSSTTSGYFISIEPKSPLFTSMSEVKQYAYNLGIGKKLFTETSKYLISKFYNENSDSESILFYKLASFELSLANQYLGYIPNIKNVATVLVFNEEEISKNLNMENVNADIKKLISKGYGVGLEITSPSIEFQDNTYLLFSYFVYNIKLASEHAADISHSSYVLRKSIEKVLRFNKTVILEGVDTPADVELLLQSNLRFLSGLAIGSPSPMLVPVARKTINRIEKIKNK